nr:MAG TPA: hypothetical protein [Crassvirales sp.]
MLKEENLNKILYKVLLKLLKLIPILGVICYFLNTLFAYFEINTWLLGYIGGMSLLPWIFMYIAEIVFKFCAHHKIFLWYIFIIETLNLVDYHIGIDISDFSLFIVHIIITGVTLFYSLYSYVKNNTSFIKRLYRKYRFRKLCINRR